MTIMRIREQSGESQGSNALVCFDYGEEYPINIYNPFSEEEEKELEWYFEEHLHFPFTKQMRAQRIAASISAYGEKLFEQVFAEREVYTIYKECVQAGLNTLQIEIAGSPAFHALHWEALKDPHIPQPLALHTTMIRKNLKPQVIRATIRPSPTINLLIVSARPLGKRDISYRTISRPLVEALRRANLPIQIDILRPGSYRALDQHLRDITAQHGTGHYHVIHFDVHGALLSYDEFQQGYEGNHYLYHHHGRYGRSDIQPYDGIKGFLFLEDEQDNTSDPVEAAEIAKLLLIHQIPIVILNACQSGKQVGANETSLGGSLIQAGVQLVLAMGYSVTVSAASLLMRTLYPRLFQGDDLAIAIRHARAELYNDKDRRVYFDQHIDLEDWLLPVVYQNRPVALTVRKFTLDENKAYHAQQGELQRYEAYTPTYGFVGRDLDILQIEKRLLTRRNLQLVRGMGGAGKTTLLHHLVLWWRTTSFVEQIFYFGYDVHAWTRQQIMTRIAKQLLSDVEYVRDFRPLSTDEQQAKIAGLLRAKRHLLILDNLESITGSHLAVQHTLVKKEQQALHDFLAALSGGSTLVLLGSRGSEKWLAGGTFDENIYDLGGLDPEAASLLADRILEKHKATRYRDDPVLQQLLKLLDGFPLALEVVLANLANQTPSVVLNALQAGSITMLDKKEPEKKTESIILCINYSHSNLSPEAQQLLICLAPFTSVMWKDMLEQYTTYLRQQPELAMLPFERWSEVVQEAMNWGLLSPDRSIPGFLHIQPILPYFLRNRMSKPEQVEFRHAVESAFREHYDEVSNILYSLLESKDSQERQTGQALIRLEYENLVTALNLGLAAETLIIHPYIALYHFLKAIGDQQRGLELSWSVINRLEEYPADKLKGQSGVELAIVIDGLAFIQLGLKQHAEAEVSYQNALKMFLQFEDIDEQLRSEMKASIYIQLGTLAEHNKLWTQAEQYVHQALQIFSDFNNYYQQALAYEHLGTIAYNQGQWTRAKEYYQQALQIWEEQNNRHSQITTYYNLGRVAENQQQWIQAEQYYQQALLIGIEFNDHLAQIGPYSGLGSVAEHRQQWTQAEQYYQQALQIGIEFDDRYQQAQKYAQLGRVVASQQQLDQAEQYYHQALQIFGEFNDDSGQSAVYQLLAELFQKQGKLAQAEEYCQHYLRICIAHNERNNQADVFSNMGNLAANQQHWVRAEEYFQQSLQISIEIGNRNLQGSDYYFLGHVAYDQQQWAKAEQYFHYALEIFKDIKDHHKQAETYHNLGLVAQAQQQWVQARDSFILALEMYLANEDAQSINDILRDLAKLWQISGDEGLPTAVASIVDFGSEEPEELLQMILGNKPRGFDNLKQSNTNEEYRQYFIVSSKVLSLLNKFANAHWAERRQLLAEHHTILLSEDIELVFDAFLSTNSETDTVSMLNELRILLRLCREWTIDSVWYLKQKMYLGQDTISPIEYEPTVMQVATILSQQQEDQEDDIILEQAVDTMQTLLNRLTSGTPYLFRAALLCDLATTMFQLSNSHPMRKLKQIEEYCREALIGYQAAAQSLNILSIQRTLGYVLNEQGRYEEALVSFKAVLQGLELLKKDTKILPWVLLGYANSLASLGEFEEVLEVYSELIKLMPENAWLHRNHAEILIRTRRLIEAEAELAHAGALENGDFSPYHWERLSQIAIARGDGLLADRMLEEAKNRDESLDITFLQAQAAWLRSDLPAAQEALRKACEKANPGYRMVIHREMEQLFDEHPELNGKDELKEIIMTFGI